MKPTTSIWHQASVFIWREITFQNWPCNWRHVRYNYSAPLRMLVLCFVLNSYNLFLVLMRGGWSRMSTGTRRPYLNPVVTGYLVLVILAFRRPIRATTPWKLKQLRYLHGHEFRVPKILYGFYKATQWPVFSKDTNGPFLNPPKIAPRQYIACHRP